MTQNQTYENNSSNSSLRADIREAFTHAVPIMAGYMVLGLPCGMLSSTAGMSWWMVGLMSITFYSGAGQYMIPNMYLAANPLLAIITSVSLVNSRQLLYGASLSQYMGSQKIINILMAATVTDESFGVNLARYMKGVWDTRKALFLNLFSMLSWGIFTALGAFLGEQFSVPATLASFAMTSLFICLLMMQPFARENVLASVGAIVGVVICKLLGLEGVSILLGALVGVVSGVLAMQMLPHTQSAIKESK